MTKPPYPSDARPSDTKSVVLHRQNDKRLLDHVTQTKGESRFWRHAAYFYLDFFEWLATQPDAPEPGRPFVYYQNYLEHLTQPANLQANVDPESLASAILPAIRSVVEAALSTALANLTLLPSPLGRGAGGEGLDDLELANLFSPDLVLE